MQDEMQKLQDETESLNEDKVRQMRSVTRRGLGTKAHKHNPTRGAPDNRTLELSHSNMSHTQRWFFSFIVERLQRRSEAQLLELQTQRDEQRKAMLRFTQSILGVTVDAFQEAQSLQVPQQVRPAFKPHGLRFVSKF